MKRYLIAVLLLITTGLIFVSWNEASPGRPDDTYHLKYKLKKGQTLNYTAKTQSEQNIEIMGQEQTSKSESETTVQITSNGSNAAGNFVYTMQINAFKVAITSAMFDTTITDPSELIGKKIQKEVNEFGDQIKSIELDSIKLNPMFAQLFSSGSEFLPNLPEKELKIGTSVPMTDIDTSFAMGGKRIVKSEMSYTLQGKEAKSGYQCLKIDFKGTLTIEGDGTYQGMMKFFLEGDGDVAGTMYFAPEEGLMVAVESESNIESTAAFTGQQNMTIPISSSSKSTLKLVK